MSLITPDFGLLFWMTLIFGIVFFVLAKWGFPIITSSVSAREERINESIKAARTAEEKLADLAQEQTRMIQETRKQQDKILKATKTQSEHIVAEAQAKANAEADRILAQAREQIAKEKENMLRDVRQNVADLSISVAEKILREKLSEDDTQPALMNKLMDEVSDNGSVKNLRS